MTTSGTFDFNLSVSEIIEEAYENIGLEARTGYDLHTAQRSLNLLLLEWGNRGLHLWTTETLNLPMVPGQGSYPLPATTVDVLEAVMRRDGVDLPMARISRADHTFLPDKNTPGRPHQFMTLRLREPVLKVWPVPDRDSDVMVINLMRQLEDVGRASNTVDIVKRYLPALIAGLAFKLSIKKQPEMAMALREHYEDVLSRAMDEDVERVSFRAVPGGRYLRV